MRWENLSTKAGSNPKSQLCVDVYKEERERRKGGLRWEKGRGFFLVPGGGLRRRIIVVTHARYVYMSFLPLFGFQWASFCLFDRFVGIGGGWLNGWMDGIDGK